MISIVIPTLNAEQSLAATLTALVPSVVEGVVREVIIVDGGSTDRTLAIIDDAGAILVKGDALGRGAQLKLGAEQARQPWLLFLHADTQLEPGWEREAIAFMERVDFGRQGVAAAAFTFALDDFGFRPRVLEKLVRVRCLVLSLPYGDQGLLLPRQLYREIGGYSALPLMEDVEIVRKLGRARMRMLRTRAVTSAVRYKSEGYTRRSLRNFVCLSGYFLGLSPRIIRRLYG
ncbi:MAG: glycosyltransferase [Hyphomicrobiaceae bacterium]|nr:glycosyltransferase [Hyphomicrobiaceae bacterium]